VQSTDKKVCLVSISLAKGGAERACAMQSEYLSALGYQVHIVILNDAIDYPYQGELLNLGERKNGQDRLLKRLARMRALRRYLHEHRFDWIIDHRSRGQFSREQFYSRYVYRGFKTIYLTHSSNAQQYVTERPRAFARLCGDSALQVAVSEGIRLKVLVQNGFKNTHTIYNAYDPAWGSTVTDLPATLAGKRYVLAYGRMVEKIKDFSFLIDAYSQSELPERAIALVIMGDGPDREIVEAHAKASKVADSILLLPFQNEPFSIIKAAQAVTLTSHYEGFPMVLVEALSLGVPVVALDIETGPSEIVQHGQNGLLIAQRSIPLFAEGLNQLFEGEEFYHRLKQHAQSSVSGFSKDKIAAQWHQLLTDE